MDRRRRATSSSPTGDSIAATGTLATRIIPKSSLDDNSPEICAHCGVEVPDSVRIRAEFPTQPALYCTAACRIAAGEAAVIRTASPPRCR